MNFLKKEWGIVIVGGACTLITDLALVKRKEFPIILKKAKEHCSYNRNKRSG